MAKFVGKLAVMSGYTEEEGVYTPSFKIFNVAGDMSNTYVSNTASDGVNDNISISNTFSIIASPSLLSLIGDNSKALTSSYLEYMGVKWSIIDLAINLPRITITVGGVWTQE